MAELNYGLSFLGNRRATSFNTGTNGGLTNYAKG